MISPQPRMTKVAIILFFNFIMFLGGCAAEKSEFFIRKDLRHQIFFEPLRANRAAKDLGDQLKGTTKNIMWFNDLFVISGQVNNKPRYLVMVKYKKGSRLAEEFASMVDKDNSSSIWLKYDPVDEATGYALVALQDEAELSGLALLTHKDAFPACGSLELLPSDLALSDQPLVGPLYSELLKIPEVEALFGITNKDEIKSTISSLESSGTRFHASNQGLTIPQKVLSLWESSSKGLTPLNMEQVPVNQSAQKSVVLSLPGQADDTQTVILGAHLDSINGGGFAEPAPGADDDATGVATLREILRVITLKNLKFKRRVELHAYGAEEVGLLGSGTLAQNYAKSARKVVGMMQFDMNGWSQAPGQKVYLIKNDTNDTLRKGVKDLMHTYFQSDFEEVNLTAGTSDHKSWTLSGYPSVFPFENPQAYNKALHTNRDTSETINNLQLTERMVHLGLAFISHYAGLVTAENSAETRSKEILATLSKDLKLAITPSSSAGSYDVTVSVPQEVKSVELCFGSKIPAVECVGDHHVLSQAQEKGGRLFYGVVEPLSLSAGVHLALFGRSDQGKITHLRTVRLDPKNP
jgi:leucyl aminopeptidase